MAFGGISGHMHTNPDTAAYKYRDTINEHLELGLFRPYFAVFSSDNAAILLKNGLYGRKIPLFDHANLLCPGN